MKIAALNSHLFQTHELNAYFSLGSRDIEIKAMGLTFVECSTHARSVMGVMIDALIVQRK